jgi:hypothetical protein
MAQDQLVGLRIEALKKVLDHRSWGFERICITLFNGRLCSG